MQNEAKSFRVVSYGYVFFGFSLGLLIGAGIAITLSVMFADKPDYRPRQVGVPTTIQHIPYAIDGNPPKHSISL